MATTKPRVLPLTKRGLNFEMFMWLFTRLSALAMYGLILFAVIGALVMGARNEMSFADILRWGFMQNANHVQSTNVPDLAPWSTPFVHEGRDGNYVTDGPFLHRTSAGALLMLWSTTGKGGYTMGFARSKSGTIQGPWMQEEAPLFSRDGGHGMIFRAFDGRLMMTVHQPNSSPNERPVFIEVTDDGDSLRVK